MSDSAAPTPKHEALIDLYNQVLRKSLSPQEARQALLQAVDDPTLVDQAIKLREETLASSDSWPPPNTLVGRAEQSPWSHWYTGVGDEDRFWPALKDLLCEDPDWMAAVPSLDQQSHDIVRQLGNPTDEEFSRRGLVLGRVQSGKTANYTSVIAKAADAGYRLFIVLAGMHNSLRAQTQERLSQQLVDQNPESWCPLTDLGDAGDFTDDTSMPPLVATGNKPVLIVVKKQKSRLESLVRWLQQAREDGSLQRTPALVVDDECDQASVNSSSDPEYERSTINRLITELVKCPRLSYVAYSATPFANLLINPADLEDLYPRDFVYALPKPDGYFGSVDLFGSRGSRDEGIDDGHDMIRVIPPEEASVHERYRGGPLAPNVTDSLDAAIRWLIMATAARRLRAGRPQHSSMLVNTDVAIDTHFHYAGIIEAHVKTLKAGWHAGDRKRWLDLWGTETEREPAVAHGLEPVGFEAIDPEIAGILDDLAVVVDNSRSEDRLLYGDEPRTVIAVGGNTLSRGLTLRGLVSSFFTRSSKQSDTMLQMGRWFGFRPGYTDLSRIWTTAPLQESFRFLGELEEALRQEIDEMIEQGHTPGDVPVRIRTHPHMHVTSPNKMRFAVPGSASYSRRYPQTVLFRHRNLDEIQQNQEAARSLVRNALGAGSPMQQGAARTVIRDVPAETVMDFIGRYSFHPDSMTSSDLLLEYISRQLACGALEIWNIVIISRKPDPAGATPTLDLGTGFPVPLITRSRLGRGVEISDSVRDTADIKGLIDQEHRIADLVDEGLEDPGTNLGRVEERTRSGRAVVLLYPIDKDSEPAPEHLGPRVALGAADHLVGLALAFPEAAKGSDVSETLMADPVRLEGESGE